MTTILSRLASFADPDLPRSLSRRGRIIAAVLVLLILLPSLLFPFASDGATFFVCAQKILAGGIHYRDYIEIKPPLVHHMYALGMLLFGQSETGVRLFDLILQIVTCWSIASLVGRASGNEIWGALSASLYAILYVGLTYDGTAQTESYVGLFAIPVMSLMIFERNGRRAFLAGILCGLLAMLKFTFGIVAVGAVLALPLALGVSRRQTIRLGLFTAAGLAVVVGLFLLYLVAFGAMDDFLVMNRFMSGYASLGLQSKGEWIRRTLQEVPAFFADNFSVLLSLAAAVAVARSFPLGAPGPGSAGVLSLLRFSVILFALLTLTIIIEGKYGVYHFSRMYPPGAILAAYGLLRIVRAAGRSEGRDIYMRLAGIAAVVTLLILSPIPRYLRHAAPIAARLTQGDKAVDRYYGTRRGYSLEELHAVADYIGSRKASGDRIFAASSVSALVYTYNDYVPDFPLFFSPTMGSPFAPPQWSEMSRRYLTETRPRFIVVQLRDSMPDITGSPMSSEEALMAVPGVRGLLDTGYAVPLRTGAFDLYERKGAGGR